jgi:glycosyltransferase involved in cell wall biosynthesis
MRIACITTHSIHDSSSWPKNRQGICGASRKISRILEADGFDVSYLGPLTRLRSPITRLKWLYYRHAERKRYYSWADPVVLNNYSQQVRKKLSGSNFDVLLCPEGFVPISKINTGHPLVLWTDTTTSSLIDFYDGLSNLCHETRNNIYRYEKAALERCNLVVLTSEWAANFAINTYNLPPDKVKVIPRGSNKERTVLADTVKSSIETRATDQCVLTFIGVDWERKGGDVALAVAARLNEMGLPTTLQTIGCKPSINEKSKFIKSLGFLHSSKPQDLRTFEDALLRSHFLILPSRAEHCAIALSEANSYGVPCLTTDVGGIPTVVQEGRNGKTFSKNNTVDDYCNYIIRYMNDPSKYQELAVSSLQEFETRLSWNVIQEKACNLFRELFD